MKPWCEALLSEVRVSVDHNANFRVSPMELARLYLITVTSDIDIIKVGFGLTFFTAICALPANAGSAQQTAINQAVCAAGLPQVLA